MSRQITAVLAVISLMLGGCATISDAIDTINPFSSSTPKMAPLLPLTATAEVHSVWSVNVGKAGDYTFTPSVVGSSVYVASKDGTVTKLEDGKLVWKVSAGQSLSAGVGANGRLVVVATSKGDVLAFSTEDGKSLWQTKVSSEVLAAPVVGDEGVAVKSGDNRVHLLDAGDGGKNGYISVRRHPCRFAVQGGQSSLIATCSSDILGANWSHCRYKMEHRCGGGGSFAQGATELDRVADVVASPVVDGRLICAVAFQGRVACFDMGQGGAMTWSRDLSSVTGLAMDSRYIFISDDKGVVYALDRQSGSSLWKQDKLKNRRLSAPIVTRGLVAVADAEGIVHFMSREDGSFAARQKTDGTPVRAPLQMLGTAVLVQTTGGYVSAIEAQ